MGTEILRPQDLLSERFRVSPPPPTYQRRRNFPANASLSNLIVNKKASYHQSGTNRRTSPKTKRSTDNRKVTGKKEEPGPVMGQVTLLRRGESLDSLTKGVNGNPNPNSKTRSPNRKETAASDDLTLPKQIRMPPPADVYAGSACTLSPSPRSVPLPSFFNRKRETVAVDDSATRDLRRLLRLD